MITIKKHWVLSLSILLSLSMALPFCCHLDISELFSHHKEMQVHSGHGQHSDANDCKCGHEFVKDYQKTKKVTDSQIVSFSSAVALHGRVLLPVNTDVLLGSFIQPGILSNSGPPLHLLISVFLN